MGRWRWWSSLTAKAVALLVIVMGAMSATVGASVSRKLVTSFQTELDKRGSSLLETLERHQELHLALSLKDRKTVEQVLHHTLASNDDLAYLAALDPEGQIVGSAVKSGDEIGTVLAELPHHGLPGGPMGPHAESDDVMRRFTQPVLPFSAGPDAAGFNLPGAEPHELQRRLLGNLVMGIRADRITRQVALQSFPVLLTAGTLILAFIGFFWLLQRRVAKMVTFAEMLAKGDLAAELPDDQPDELGRLAAALRRLRESTLSVVTQLHDAADVLASSSSEVLEAAEAQLTRANRQARTDRKSVV